MHTQTYTVTINMPPGLEEHLEKVTENYVTEIKKQKLEYIQTYEHCKSGKLHAHIGYQKKYKSEPKNTSNHTKTFNKCYNTFFVKKDHPKAIQHGKHDNFEKLISYITKDVKNYDNLNTSINDIEYIKQLREKYKKPKPKESVYYSQQQIADGFVHYYHEHKLAYKFGLITHAEMVIEYLQTVQKKVGWNAWSRLNIEKLVQYAKIKTPVKERLQENLENIYNQEKENVFI